MTKQIEPVELNHQEKQDSGDDNNTKSPIGLIISFVICLALAVLYAVFKG